MDLSGSDSGIAIQVGFESLVKNAPRFKKSKTKSTFFILYICHLSKHLLPASHLLNTEILVFVNSIGL